ncbi:glycosyltransferase family 2 protein [Candidatus Beckwithbacteria bacterium CG10_big_fil_rev_8_21_14_0_10_34_10]|uniref:Glycosyltransferase family 2 protein n=1 Tax=Candidatus Beckwithbacteria bacterium CG10_big_fil_rev_8_21_14_0_10_34_10 TaxID=1974495 RepID=A0A2H0W9T8_9BACT|nr:MAG: glycosyltransferase family 2 protein [Candidatus Beckwithbacteria bacterium CG10_big_fil_rev_8_21_14_0_10_34_10]
MKVVIIIPTYNERENIKNTLKALEEVFPQVEEKYEMHILVVDDSSPDGTGEIVKELMKTKNFVHLFVNKEKAGLGAAYIKGMKYAIEKLQADLVFEFDADGSHQPKYIPGMLKEVTKGADVVVGSRYVPGGSMPKDWGFDRKLISFFGNLMCQSVLFTWQYKDMTSGYRVSKTSFLKRIDLDALLSKQFAYKIHLYYAFHKLKAKIVEFPIAFVDRAKGKTKFPKNNIIDSLRVIFTLRFRESKKFIQVCIVGTIGAIIQFSIFNLLRLKTAPEYANVIAVEFAVIANFIINNLWTFKDDKIAFKNIKKLLFKFFQFNLISLGSISIQFVVMKIGVSVLGRSTLLENGLVMIGILIGLVWNYTMYTKLIWKKKK